MDAWVWVLLVVGALWALQIAGTHVQMSHYRGVLGGITREGGKGYVGAGNAKARLGKGVILIMISDEDGFVLTLMKAGRQTTMGYPETFHIGFFIDSEATVDAIHRRLIADGFVVPAPARHNHGYGFYVDVPGGFTVELGPRCGGARKD